MVGLSEGHSVDLRADPMGGHLGDPLVGRLERAADTASSHSGSRLLIRR